MTSTCPHGTSNAPSTEYTEASGGNRSGPSQMARSGGHSDVSLRGPCKQGIGTEEEAPCEEGPDHGVPKASEGTSAVVLTAPTVSVVDEPILVDLSESLLASQSNLGPYWGRSVSRKRDRPELVDLCQEEDSGEEEQPERTGLGYLRTR